MATIQQAVQVMVDKLVADMNGETPLSAEEQALVTSAVAKLQNNTQLETAVVAVAEEHLTTATQAVTQASTAANTSSEALQQSAENLALIPSMQSSLAESVSALNQDIKQQVAAIPQSIAAPQNKVGEPNFVLDYYDNTCVNLPSGSDTYGAYNAISLVDYVSSEFYAYWDGGNKTSGSNKATLLHIDKQGQVSQATRATQLLTTNGTDNILLLRLNDGSVRAATYTTASNILSLYQSMAFTVDVSNALDYFKLYQDHATGLIYGVNAGILHQLSASGWKQIIDTTFLTEASFDTWASEHEYTALHDLSIKPRVSNTGITSGTGDQSSLAYLYLNRPPVLKELTYETEGVKNITLVGRQNLARAVTENRNGTDNIFTRLFRSRIKLADKNGHYVVTMASQTASNNSNGATHQYTPELVVHSPLHRAVIVNQYFQFYYSSGSQLNDTKRRIYFA